MDLVPKPDQVAAAAGNVAQLLLGGGVADLRPMPRTLVARGAGHEVYRYRPEPDRERPGDPVLLVAPLAAPASCYDLRRGCSLVERLLRRGRPTYLVEFGETSFADPDLGLEPWVRHAVPTAVRAVSDHAGGAAVHLLGWSLGGIFALLAAADATDLPIVSLSVLGAPVDTTRVPMMAPPRPLLTASDWPDLVARTYRAIGAPAPLRWAFERAPVQRLVVRPMAVAAHLDDADWLAQLEAVERFTAATTAYAGRSYGQLYHRFGQGNALASGAIEVEIGRAHV